MTTMTTITHPASPPATALQDRVGPLDAARHILTLAWRSLVQIRHNPMELGDLSLQPLMFVALFAYVFGGAIAGSPKEYLQFGQAGIQLVDDKYSLAKKLTEMLDLYQRTVSGWRGRG